MTDSERIAALEAKVERLQAQIGALIKLNPINLEIMKKHLPGMLIDVQRRVL